MMDCIEPKQTVYLYHPSINDDSDLLKDYNGFYQHYYKNDDINKHGTNTPNLFNDDDESIDDKKSQSPTRSHSRAMSVSYQSYQSTNGDDQNMAIIEPFDLINDNIQQHTHTHTSIDNNYKNKKILTEQEKEQKDTFFNTLNLYFAYAGNKYGIDHNNLMEDSNKTQLIQITHSILVWALRKMDTLWKQKPVQQKLQHYLKLHSFPEKDIIDIVMFGNKLTDENVQHLIKYRFDFKF